MTAIVQDDKGTVAAIGDRFCFTAWKRGAVPHWLTQGYGRILEITPRGVVVYEHSALIGQGRVGKAAFALCARINLKAVTGDPYR